MSERDDRLRRSTRQRAAISQALGDSERFITAQELHDRLRRRGVKVGLTTVYRTLQMLSDAGEVDVLHSGGNEAVYRTCDADVHHHHLVCRDCRRTVEISSDDLERWAHTIADRHGFVSPSHTLEIFGLCADCAPAAR
jgi:Fur family ferric uptake transcriptional regulator